MVYYYRRSISDRGGNMVFVVYAVAPIPGEKPDPVPVAPCSCSLRWHASIQTTMGYSHLQAEHLRALVDEPTPISAKMKEASL